MASNPVDPEQPPRVADMFHVPLMDTAPDAPACEEHPDVKPRRVLRGEWICPACVRDSSLSA